MIDIASLFKLARVNLKMSMTELSKQTGISVGTIRNYEMDKTIPSVKNSIILTRVLQIPLQEIGITEETFNEIIGDITYTKKYIYNHDLFFEGHCKCGNNIFISDKDFKNPLRTKCKKCTANQNVFSNLDSSDIEKLDNLFQNNIVKRSMKLKLPCTISLLDYIELITKECYYCGEKSSQRTMINGKLFLHNGLDRVDSTKGYEIKNIVPCCGACNMLKGSLKAEEFIALIEKIHNHQKKN